MLMETIETYFLEYIGLGRWDHSLRVLGVARELGQIYGVDQEKITIAALLHDCAKFRDRSLLLKKARSFDILLDELSLHNMELIHAPLGAIIAEKEFYIRDKDVLNAIRYHTTGRKAMTSLEKVIFIADYIEPSRNFSELEEIRKLAYSDIDRSIVLAIDTTIKYLIKENMLISLESVEARNYLKIDILNREEGIDEGNR